MGGKMYVQIVIIKGGEMRVKIFSGYHYSSLESIINEWLQQSKAEIEFVTQSGSDNETITISIFYRVWDEVRDKKI